MFLYHLEKVDHALSNGVDKAPALPLSPARGGSKTPLRNSSAVSASYSVQLSPIGSRPRFFQRRTYEASTFPLSPSAKGGLKIPLRNFANQSNSCVARSLCDS